MKRKKRKIQKARTFQGETFWERQLQQLPHLQLSRHVMGGNGYTAPSDMINVAGIGIGSQGGGDIQQLCTPDVPIVRPQRNMNGTPMTKEQLEAWQARMAEFRKRNPAPGGANTNAAVQMEPLIAENSLNWLTSMPYAI